jgi:hypothetical protein
MLLHHAIPLQCHKTLLNLLDRAVRMKDVNHLLALPFLVIHQSLSCALNPHEDILLCLTLATAYQAGEKTNLNHSP